MPLGRPSFGGMRRIAPCLLCCLALAACGAWPDVPLGVQRDPGGTWPVLRPSAELLAEAPPVTQDDQAAENLNSRAEALRRRADLMRAPVPDGDAFEALRARIGG